MNLLTGVEIDSIYNKLRGETFEQSLRSVDFARAIESAVLAKLRSAEPFCTTDLIDDYFLNGSGIPLGLPLYTHPDPKLAEVEKQRDELLKAVGNLIKVKGRYHTEQAYSRLIEAYDKVKGGAVFPQQWAGEAYAMADALLEAQKGGKNESPGQADLGGWIVWNGGECPVSDADIVEVRLGSGLKHPSRLGRLWDWSHDSDFNSNIIAYRVVQKGGAA